MTIAIVTDSTSDIPEEIAASHGIQVVPAILVVNGLSLVDGQGFSREEFYQQLPTMKSPPTTATPSSGTFEVTYRRLFEQGAQHIISLHPSTRLSGVFNAAVIAARQFGKRVTVIDSSFLSLGLGFQAVAAAEAALRQATLDEILTILDDIRRRTILIAMLDTLEYVRRSGRVSWAVASLGSLFQIKPFIRVQNGELLKLGEARTRKKGIGRLYELLTRLGSLERLAILHTNAEADARQMLGDFLHQVKSQPLMVNVTTVIGTHAGPNGLGFVAVIE